ncbi:MAG: hypothetical protein GY722_06070, partial [bacterium]|nr:hypothetical protein [bacterium]
LSDRIVYWGENATEFAANYNRRRTVAGVLATLGVVMGVVDSGDGSDDDPANSLEATDHGNERRRQARDGDTHRQVGDPNRVVAEGRRHRDTETGNTIYVKGDRVVVLDKDGRQVTQFTNTRRNTRKRVRDGLWIPESEEEAPQ